MEKIKAGIIGCGRISSVYQAAFENMKDEVELAFVVDKEVCRLDRGRRRGGRVGFVPEEASGYECGALYPDL